MTGTILVTGALGYLGGRIAQHLAQSGEAPLRLTTRRQGAQRPAWCTDMAVVTVDDKADLDALCDGVSAIVHLAGANEHLSAADPERALADTTAASLRLLAAAERQGVGRFVYLSTAHVYGAPLQGRIDESCLPRPTHPYAITHRAAEDFVLAAHHRGAIAGAVLRLSNALGAPADPLIDRWTLIGNDLCRQAVAAGQLTLHTAGLQQRDFIALSDVCRAVGHVLDLPAAKLGDGLYNVGGERSRAIIEIAEMVAARSERILGHRPTIERPAPADDETAPMLDYRIDKLKATGFALAGSLEDEIDGTLILCREGFAK
jgi:UDP-glucose 4-epimerase